MIVRIQFILLAILALALAISVNRCNENKAEAMDYKAQLDYQDSTITVLQNSVGQLVAEHKSAVTENKATVKKLSDQVFNMSKAQERQIKTVTALVQGHQVVTLRDTLIDFIEVPGAADTTGFIAVPRDFAKVTPHYSITGKVVQDGIRIDSLVMKNTMSFRIGERRNNIFRPTEVVVQAINSNPYFNTVGLQSITVKARPNAWNRWIKPALAGLGGAAAGGYLSKKFF